MKSKADRQEWWRQLPDEEKSKYIFKKEHERAVSKPALKLDVKPLTKRQIKAINSRMRKIGMEQYIVLPW